MMVKHIHAGWVGVIVNDMVINSGISFSLKRFGTSQLREHSPSIKEMDQLVKGMTDAKMEGYEAALSYLKSKYNVKATK